MFLLDCLQHRTPAHRNQIEGSSRTRRRSPTAASVITLPRMRPANGPTAPAMPRRALVRLGAGCNKIGKTREDWRMRVVALEEHFTVPGSGSPHRSRRHQPPRLQAAQGSDQRRQSARAAARYRRAAAAVHGRGRHYGAGALEHRTRPRSGTRRRRRRHGAGDERLSGGGGRAPSRPVRRLRRAADAEAPTPARRS